jgi:3-oxoacid CoA-transferase B subunit
MTPPVGARSRHQIAARVAQDLADGAVVNLGIGMPTLVASYVPVGREVLFHSENGILGIGPPQDGAPSDPDLINASKEPISLLTGGSYFSHADSFAMIRGGQIDIAIMGAFQVSAAGDLANWSTGHDHIPAIGGAMDLAVGAERVFVMTSHQTATGEPKLLAECTFPLTASRAVSRVYTDLAVLDVVDGEFVVRELVDGLTLERLQAITPASLRSPSEEERRVPDIENAAG